MYVETRNSVLIDSSFRTDHGMATERALIDSGATDNFIDQRTADRLKIKPRRLQQPRVLHNVDGTTNKDGKVTYYCNLLMQQGKNQAVQRLYIANLGRDRIILGYPWLHQFNPPIDWREKKVKAPPLRISRTSADTTEENLSLRQARMIARHVQLTDQWEEGDALYLHAGATQEWAIKENQGKQQRTVNDIPDEYQQHRLVFDEEASY